MAEQVQPKKRREVSIVIKILVILHLLAIFSWSLPNPPKSLYNIPATPELVMKHPLDYFYLTNHTFRWGTSRGGDSQFRKYLWATGTWQAWNMFAPNPSSYDSYYDAEITYLDGTKKIVPYPRMYTMSLGEKYFKERYRKFTEHFDNNEGSWKWPTLAQWMAYISYDDPNNPPTLVVMRRHWRNVKPMNETPQANYNDYSFFRYVVDRRKLIADKKLEK